MKTRYTLKHGPWGGPYTSETVCDDWKDAPMWHHKRGLSFTATGYGEKIPLATKVKIAKRWYRIYCTIHSNSGVCWVNYNQKRTIIDQEHYDAETEHV